MARLTIIDGGMGRELEDIGAPFRQPEWSALALLESPDHVRQVHFANAAAGAEVITTNAYAIVPFHLGDERFATEGRRLARLAGSLARSVADEFVGVSVAGCIPPVLGSYRPDLFNNVDARPIIEVLVSEQEPFVDLWLAETQSSIAEVELVRSVLDAFVVTQPLWASFTLADSLNDEGKAVLRSGESVTAAARAAEGLAVRVLLFNCSPPEVMEAAVGEARAACELTLGAYANRFVLEPGEGANATVNDLRDDVTPEAYVEWAQRWVAAGATVVGGCCGVGAGYVSALSTRLSAR